MKLTEFKFFIFAIFIILVNLPISNKLVQSKEDSILKIFCRQSVKKEMLKADIAYSEELANKTCECYYEEFIQTSSHQDAKTKCKLETKENLNHNKKI